jgi:putative acetyltransferase
MFEIRPDDLSGEKVRALLALHLAGMQASSPAGSVFALDLSGLMVPEVSVWTVWRGDAIAGVGALRALGGGIGEVKSMRTHPDFLRMGVGRLLLDFLIGEARGRGWRRLSLETGRGPSFAAAEALYVGRGFVEGEAFGDYVGGGFNRFFHLAI